MGNTAQSSRELEQSLLVRVGCLLGLLAAHRVVCHTPECVGRKAGILQSLLRPPADLPAHLGVPREGDSKRGFEARSWCAPSPTNSILFRLLGLHLQAGRVTGLQSGVGRVLAHNSGPSGILLRDRFDLSRCCRFCRVPCPWVPTRIRAHFPLSFFSLSSSFVPALSVAGWRSPERGISAWSEVEPSAGGPKPLSVPVVASGLSALLPAQTPAHHTCQS